MIDKRSWIASIEKNAKGHSFYGYGAKKEEKEKNKSLSDQIKRLNIIENLEIDHLWINEFKHMHDSIYLDHAGTTMYTQSQLHQTFHELSQHIFTNPHSLSINFPSSQVSTSVKIATIQRQILHFFHTSASKYSVIFTSGATGAIKLVGECLPWTSNSEFLYSFDSHTSVLGIRQFVQAKNGNCKYLSLQEMQELEHYNGIKRECIQENYDTVNLMAFPAECNFSGTLHSLSIIENLKYYRPTTSSWLTLVDAAKFVSTHPLDLSQYEPDFIVVSFYKMFGYPTGLGALLVLNKTLDLLQQHKVYFGGGTVDRIAAHQNICIPRKGSMAFSDGTPSFQSIFALSHGFDVLEKLTMKSIEGHTQVLTKLLYNELKELKHANGNAVCTIYGQHETKNQGPILAFNIMRPDNTWVGYNEVRKLAELHHIYLRYGCFCNPGACHTYLQHSDEDIQAAWNAGHVCGDDIDVVNGQPTGAIRASIGYMTRYEDICAFIHFIQKYFQQQTGISLASDQTVSVGDISYSVQLEKITVFPIKSCAGMVVRRWPIGPHGLLYDREFVIIDRYTKHAITLSAAPKLCLIHPTINLEAQTLQIAFSSTISSIDEKLDDIIIPMYKTYFQIDKNEKNCSENSCIDIKVCTNTCASRIDTFSNPKQQEMVSKQLSKFLNRDVLLVRASAGEESRSAMNTIQSTTNAPESFTPRLGFANQAQFLLISRASIAIFNQTLQSTSHDIESVHEDVFRANFIVDGCPPFSEDQWTHISIISYDTNALNHFKSSIDFNVVGPCSRCRMININLHTATYNNAPLKTLASFRREKSKILFGQYLVLQNHTDHSNKWVHIGDQVQIRNRDNQVI